MRDFEVDYPEIPDLPDPEPDVDLDDEPDVPDEVMGMFEITDDAPLFDSRWTYLDATLTMIRSKAYGGEKRPPRSPRPERSCPGCGMPFVPKRDGTVTCSPWCRQRFARARLRLAEPPDAGEDAS